jgi:Holliday junction DNA helicase RuvA
MIAFLKGEVISIGVDSMVLLTGGVGIKVNVTQEKREQTRPGETAALYTHLVVREDSLTLYGFDHEDERDFFILLIGVNGVGPRIAMSILSTLSVDAIRRAVLSEQADIFNRVPGVGKKNAQKILLHLQGRVIGDIPFSVSLRMDSDTIVLDALTGLGYSVVEAQTALQSLPKDAVEDVEERLRLALQFFGG